jgi:hypothetical protein
MGLSVHIMPISQACEIATKKSQNWIALLAVGGAILVTILILAMIGLAFGVPEVAAILLTVHESGAIYLAVIAGIVLIVVALMKRHTKDTFCGLD